MEKCDFYHEPDTIFYKKLTNNLAYNETNEQMDQMNYPIMNESTMPDNAINNNDLENQMEAASYSGHGQSNLQIDPILTSNEITAEVMNSNVEKGKQDENISNDIEDENSQFENVDAWVFGRFPSPEENTTKSNQVKNPSFKKDYNEIFKDMVREMNAEKHI